MSKESVLGYIEGVRRHLEVASNNLRDALGGLTYVQSEISMSWPDTPTDPPPPEPPQDGVVRVSIPGLVHRATEETPRRVIPIDAPQGAVFGRATLKFSYVHQWNAERRDGIHTVAYLHAQRWNPDGVLCNLITRGEPRSVTRASSNLGARWSSSEVRSGLFQGDLVPVEVQVRSGEVFWSVAATGRRHETGALEIVTPTDGRRLELWLGGVYEAHPDAQDVPSIGAEWHDLEIVLVPA